MGISFAAMSLLTAETGYGYGGEARLETEAWAIYVDQSGVLQDWYGVGDNPRPDQLNLNQYFFRVGDGPLRSLNWLGLQNTTISDVTHSAILDFQSWGDLPLFNAQLTYQVQGRNRLYSTVTQRLSFTNLSREPLDITVYGYHDLDLDNTPSDEGAKLLPAGDLYQSSTTGSSVRVNTSVVRESPFDITAGPDRYQIGQLPNENSLYNGFRDEWIGNLSNGGDFDGPGDAEFAFQYQLSLSGVYPTSEVIRTSYQGVFTRIVLPDPQVDPDPNDQSFVITDPTPAGKGEGPVFYDPDVAVGYDYELTPGSGNQFAELYLPTGYGDNLYTLIITDESHPDYGMEIEVRGWDDTAISFDLTFIDNGTEYGIDSFRILGIETDANVDPTDPYGFPTGLTFLNHNPIQLTQSAISVFVPEPGTLALLGVGVLGLFARRK